MQNEVMFAGFGGQGVMLIGQMLAYAAMEEGKQVIWLPSYGPEMRGGTAYCWVVVSDHAIGSPIMDHPESIAVMNQPSLEKFAPRVKKGGLLITNTSLIPIRSDRTDIHKVDVPANQIAMDGGTGKAANMAILGAYVGFTRVVGLESVKHMIKKTFGKKPPVEDMNRKIAEQGFALGEAARKAAS
jgi:2-oxoglutarate ferredoxin oxidoreductase subunit gamma